MRNLLARIPWFLGAPAFVGAVLVAAFAANYLGADYFKRTTLVEVNPLAGVAAAAGASPSASPTAAPRTPAPAQATTPPPATPPVSSTVTPGPQLVSQGTFRDGEPGHRGSGTAKLGRDASGNPVLVLEDFSVTNGPDLHVILGTSPGGGQGLDLGKLKATDGTFSYAIPADTELAQFKSVTIWCASFPTVFAVATLGAA